MRISVIFCDAEFLKSKVNSVPIHYAIRRFDIKYVSIEIHATSVLHHQKLRYNLDSVRLGSSRMASHRLSSPLLSSACLGSSRLGSPWLGSARVRSARPGSVRLVSCRLGSETSYTDRSFSCFWWVFPGNDRRGTLHRATATSSM